MASTLLQKHRNMTPVKPQTQAQQTVLWSKPPVQLPKVLHGFERFDGAPLKLKHVVPRPGQRRFLLGMECACGSSSALQGNVSSPFASAEYNISRLAKGTRKVVVAQEVQDAEMVPWDELFQADNDKLHSSAYVPKFDDMVCATACMIVCMQECVVRVIMTQVALCNCPCVL